MVNFAEVYFKVKELALEKNVMLIELAPRSGFTLLAVCC